jgi:glycosyltransferase involved in cell wall biosynthesis
MRFAEEFPGISFISEKDRGIYHAMNKGIERAKGEWLYFLGSDDTLYDENTLEEVSPQLMSQRADVYYGNVLLKGDTSWALSGTLYDKEFDLEKLLSKNISHQAIFYNRSVFKRLGGFDDKYKVLADWDFNLRCFARVKCVYIAVTVARFTGGGSSTISDDPLFFTDRIDRLKQYFNVSYFNRLFSKEYPLFKVKAIEYFKKGKIYTSLSFLLPFLYFKTLEKMRSKE